MTVKCSLDPSSVTVNIVLASNDDLDVVFLQKDGDESSEFKTFSGGFFPAKREVTDVEAHPVLDATDRSDESLSSSSTSTQTPRQQPPTDEDRSKSRAVRFLTDDSNRVVEQVYRYKAVSDRRKDRCYMSKAELGEAVSKANQFAEGYARLHEDWHGTVESLLLQSPAHDDDLVDGDDTGDEDTQEAILILTESSARGLEFSSKLLQKHQEWANRSVLRRYHQLVTKMASEKADDEQSPPSSTDVSDLLRERCEHVNRFTRRLAFHMARGDAIQARIVYEEDDTWATWK